MSQHSIHALAPTALSLLPTASDMLLLWHVYKIFKIHNPPTLRGVLEYESTSQIDSTTFNLKIITKNHFEYNKCSRRRLPKLPNHPKECLLWWIRQRFFAPGGGPSPPHHRLGWPTPETIITVNANLQCPGTPFWLSNPSHLSIRKTLSTTSNALSHLHTVFFCECHSKTRKTKRGR